MLAHFVTKSPCGILKPKDQAQTFIERLAGPTVSPPPPAFVLGLFALSSIGSKVVTGKCA